MKLSVDGDKTLVAARLLRKRRPLYMRLDVFPFVILHGVMFLLYVAALWTAPDLTGPGGAALEEAMATATSESDIVPNATNATSEGGNYRDSPFYLPSLVGGPLFFVLHVLFVLATHWFVEFEVGSASER